MEHVHTEGYTHRRVIHAKGHTHRGDIRMKEQIYGGTYTRRDGRDIHTEGYTQKGYTQKGCTCEGISIRRDIHGGHTHGGDIQMKGQTYGGDIYSEGIYT